MSMSDRLVKCANCAHAEVAEDSVRWCQVFRQYRSDKAARVCDEFESPISATAIDRIAKDIIFQDWLEGGTRGQLRQAQP
jgi:hypothetical protein